MTLHAVGALPFSELIAGGDSPALARLTNWFANGARLASQTSWWERAVKSAPKISLLYPNPSAILVGTMIPAMTRAARPYGFGIVEERSNPSERGVSAALPCGNRAFFDDCADIIDACRSEASWSAVQEHLNEAVTFDHGGGARVAENFMEISRQRGGARVLEAMLGHDATIPCLSALFRVIRARTRAGAGPRSVRVPLWGNEPRAGILIWLALARTVARWTHKVPSVFWTVDREDPWGQIEMTEEPDAESFASLWIDDPDSSLVLDLRRPEIVSSEPINEAISACLGGSDASLGDLLSTLEAVG